MGQAAGGNSKGLHSSSYKIRRSEVQRSTGMKRMVTAEGNSRSSGLSIDWK